MVLKPWKSHLRFRQNSFVIPSKIFIKSPQLPSNELSITTSLIRLNHQTRERHNKTDHGGYANINNGTGGHTYNPQPHQNSFCKSPEPGERHNKTDHGGYANINNGTGRHTDNHQPHEISVCTSTGPGERHNKTDHGGYANINNGTAGQTKNHQPHQISVCTSPEPRQRHNKTDHGGYANINNGTAGHTENHQPHQISVCTSPWQKVMRYKKIFHCSYIFSKRCVSSVVVFSWLSFSWTSDVVFCIQRWRLLLPSFG